MGDTTIAQFDGNFFEHFLCFALLRAGHGGMVPTLCIRYCRKTESLQGAKDGEAAAWWTGGQ
jgi:hypothetical protein